MFNDKKIRRNLNRLKIALRTATDIDFAITYIQVLEEYDFRKRTRDIDNVINDIKKID